MASHDTYSLPNDNQNRPVREGPIARTRRRSAGAPGVDRSVRIIANANPYAHPNTHPNANASAGPHRQP